MTYEQKLKIADAFIGAQVPGFGWEQLSDINSLHDCDSKEEIEEACRERLHEDGFVVEEDEESVFEDTEDDEDDLYEGDDENDEDAFFGDDDEDE